MDIPMFAMDVITVSRNVPRLTAVIIPAGMPRRTLKNKDNKPI
jgi:hypothetical protein